MKAAIHDNFVKLAHSTRRTQLSTAWKWKRLVEQFRSNDVKLDREVSAALERVLRGCEPRWTRRELDLLTRAIDDLGFPALQSSTCASRLHRSFVQLGGRARSCDAVEAATRAVLAARQFVADGFGSWTTWFELTEASRREASGRCAEPEVLLSLSPSAFRTLDKVCARKLRMLAEAASTQASEDDEADTDACSTFATDNTEDEGGEDDEEETSGDDEAVLVKVTKVLCEQVNSVEALAMEAHRKQWKPVHDAIAQQANTSSGANVAEDQLKLLVKAGADAEERMRLVVTQSEERGRIFARFLQDRG